MILSKEKNSLGVKAIYLHIQKKGFISYDNKLVAKFLRNKNQMLYEAIVIIVTKCTKLFYFCNCVA